MPATDTRIIQMQFQNKQFEKNIAKSKKSLDDFKKAMDFDATSKGMSKFAQGANGLDFNQLSNNIQRLTDKFTGLGDAGEYVVSRVRASIEGAARSVESFIKSISLEQIAVGQSKYDSLNKAVMTIVATGKHTEEEAYGVFERLMTYTGETSYSFSDMVGQISAFTAAGQDLTASERAMEGIANASAKAGQGVGQATNAMQIFAKALGNGSLNLQQWQSLNLSAHFITEEFRQTLMDTAVEMGTLTKQADKYYTATGKGKKELVQLSNLETTLNKDWATSAVLMATLQKYYFQDIDDPNADWTTFAGTAATAAQRALSLADAINAMKEAVSAGWMTSFRLMFGDLTEAMETFTNVANRAIEMLDSVSEWRNNILMMWNKYGGRKSLIEVFLGDYGESVRTGTIGILDIIDEAGKVVSDAFWDFMHIFAAAMDPVWGTESVWGNQAAREVWLGKKLRDITDSVRNFIQGLKAFFTEEIQVGDQTKSRLEIIGDAMRGLVSIMYFAMGVVRGIARFLTNLYQQLKPGFDLIWAFLSAIGNALYDFANDVEKNQSLIKFFDDMATIFTPLTTGINALVGSFLELVAVLITAGQGGEDAKSIFELIGDGLRWLAGVITNVAVPVIDFFRNFFGIFSEEFQNGINAESLSAAWTRVVELFKNTFFSIFEKLQTFVGNASEWLAPVFETIKTAVIDGFNNLLAKAKEVEVLKPIIEWFENAYATIRDFFVGMFQGGEGNTDFIYSAVEWIKGIYDSISTWFGTLFQNAQNSDIFGPIITWITGAIESIRTFFSDIFANAKNSDTFGPVITWFGSLYETVKNFVLDLFDKASNIPIVGQVVNWIRNIFGKIKDAFGKLFGGKQGSEALGTEIAETFSGTVSYVNKALSKEFSTGTAGGFGAGEGGGPKGIIQTVAEWIRNVFKSIKDVFAGFTSNLYGEGETFGERIGKIFKWLEENVGLSKLLLILGGIAAGFVVVKLIVKVVRFFKYLADGIITIAGLIKGTAKHEDDTEYAQPFYKKMMIIAGAIAVLTACVLALANLQLPAALQGMGLMAAIIISLWGVSKLMAKSYKQISFGSALGGAVSMVAIALAVGRIVRVIQPFSSLSSGQYYQVLGGLFAVVTGLAVLVGVVQKTGNVKGADTKLISLAGVAFGVAILVRALMPLANMSLEQLKPMGVALAGVLVALGAFAHFVSKNNVTMKDTQMIQIAALALGIAILVRALMPLKDLPQPELEKLGLILIAVLGILYAFTRAISVTASSLKDTQLIQIAALALGIAILVRALMPLSSIADPAAFAKMGLSLLVILGLLFAFALGVSKFKLSMKGTGMLQMIALALSIAVLVFALQPLADMDLDRLLKMGAGLVATLGMLALVVAAAKHTSIVGGVGALLMLLGITGVILALGAALFDMKQINPDVIWAFTIGISAMIVSIAASVAILGALGGGTLAIGGIVALIAAIVLVFGAIALMIPLVAQATGSALTDIGGKLVIVADMLSTFANTMNGVDESGIDRGQKIIDKCASLFMNVTSIKSGSTREFTTALYELGLGLKYFGEDISGITDPEGHPAFKVIDLLIEKQAQISSFNFHDAAVQIGYLGAGLYLFEEGAQEVPSGKNPALEFLTSLSDIAAGLSDIEGMNIDKFKSVVSGLGGALYIYAEGAKSVAGIEIGDTPDVTAAVALLNAISDSLTGENAFQIPADFPNETEMAGFGADLAALAIALQKFAAASTDLGDSGTYALHTLDFLAEIKKKLTKNEIEVFKVFGNNGVSSLVMGSFALDIVVLGGALKKFADASKGFPEDTSEMTNLLDFLSTLKSKLTADEFLLDFFNIFTKNDVSGNVLSTFGTDIRNLGGAMASFADSTTLIDETTGEIKPIDFSKAIEALEGIASIKEKLPDVGGALQWVIGQRQPLSDLGGELVGLGTGLNDFATKVQGEGGESVFDPDAVDTAIDTTDKIADLAMRISAKIPKLSGILPLAVALLLGRETTLTDFGTQMASFGGDLEKVAEGIRAFMGEDGKSEITEDNVDFVIGVVEDCIGLIGSINTTMPRLNIVGGRWSTLWGGKSYDLATIGEQVGAFGAGIKSLGDGLAAFQPGEGDNKITKKGVNNALGIINKAVDWLGKLNEKISEVKGGAELFATTYGEFIGEGSTISFSTVGEQIGAFGTGLQELGSGLGNFKNVNSDQVTVALGAVDSAYTMLSDLSSQLPKVGGLGRIIGNVLGGREQELKDLGGQIGKLGEGLGDFGTAISGKFTNGAEVATAVDVFSSIINFMAELAFKANKLSEDNLLLEIGDYSALAWSVNSFVKTITQVSDSSLDVNVFDAIVNTMDYISKAIKSVGGVDSEAIVSFGNMVSALTDLSNINVSADFAYIGKMIDDGIAKGITDNQSSVLLSVLALAENAKEVLMFAWGIASPSKVFSGIGGYAAEGLANGLVDGTGIVSNAGETLANSAVAEAIATLSRIGEEVQPTITPTIDFSQAEADMANYRKTRRGLVLDTSSAAGVAGRVVRSVESTAASNNQNGVDLSGVYSRINELGSKIAQLGQQIGNVRIVLDSGVIAGAVTDGVDSNVGRKMFYARRGN